MYRYKKGWNKGYQKIVKERFVAAIYGMVIAQATNCTGSIQGGTCPPIDLSFPTKVERSVAIISKSYCVTWISGILRDIFMSDKTLSENEVKVREANRGRRCGREKVVYLAHHYFIQISPLLGIGK